MSCKHTYLTTNGEQSELFKQLTDKFGFTQGEVMYLSSKLYNWHPSVLNTQGEPTYEAMISGNPDIKQLQKMSDSEIYNNIVDSAKKIDFYDSKGEHRYELNGEPLVSTSEKVNKYVPYTPQVNKDIDYDYAKEGTRHHKIFELLVNKSTFDEVNKMFSLTDSEKTLVRGLQQVISHLESKGKLISEFKVADSERGMAGTIDLMLIKPNGKVEIYDLKTSFETPGRKAKGVKPWSIYETTYDNGMPISNYKAKRYSLQTNYYKSILERSDKVTGRKAVDVDGVFIIPIEFFGEENNWTHATIGSIEDISNWRADGVNFDMWSQSIIKNEMRTAKEKNLKLEGNKTVDIDNFVDVVIGDSKLPDNVLNSYANNIVLNNENEDSFNYHGVKYKWESDNKANRVEQVKRIMSSEENKGDDTLINNAIETLTTGNPEGLFAKDEVAHKQLLQMYDYVRPVRVFKLSELEGFEKYNDIMVFQRGNGTIELIKLTNDNLNIKLPVKNKPIFSDIKERLNNNKNSIAGNFMSHTQALSSGIALENTKQDKEKLRLGLIAMKLKQTNPDMKVDRILIQSISRQYKTSPMPATLTELLPQIKKIYEISDVKSAVSGEVKALLSNDELYKDNNYIPNAVDELLNYFDSNLEEDDFKNQEDKWNSRAVIRDKLEKYKDGEIEKDELFNFLLDYERGIKNIIAKKYAGLDQSDIENLILGDSEFIRFANILASLQDIKLYPEKDITEEVFGNLRKTFSNPSLSGKRTLDQAFHFTRNFIDKVKVRLTEFNEEKMAVMDKLRRDAGGLNAGPLVGNQAVNANAALGLGTDAFTPLIQTKTDGKGKTYYTPFFWAEGSAEFNELSTAQQDTIRWFNKKFQSIFREAHPEKNKDGTYKYTWTPNMIPILKSNPSDYVYKAKKNILRGEFKEGFHNIEKNVARGFDLVTGQFEYQDTRKYNNKLKMYDVFANQVVNGQPNPTALLKMGLDENLNLLNGSDNGNFQLDLDATIQVFKTTTLRK
jgi:hypothetical protein